MNNKSTKILMEMSSLAVLVKNILGGRSSLLTTLPIVNDFVGESPSKTYSTIADLVSAWINVSKDFENLCQRNISMEQLQALDSSQSKFRKWRDV